MYKSRPKFDDGKWTTDGGFPYEVFGQDYDFPYSSWQDALQKKGLDYSKSISFYGEPLDQYGEMTPTSMKRAYDLYGDTNSQEKLDWSKYQSKSKRPVRSSTKQTTQVRKANTSSAQKTPVKKQQTKTTRSGSNGILSRMYNYAADRNRRWNSMSWHEKLFGI